MPYPVETPQHRALRDAVDTSHGTRRRRFLVAVDGVDGAGKSTLSRYLGWQFGMSVIECDLYMRDGVGHGLAHRLTELSTVIDRRLSNDRPVIVEGVCIVALLGQMGLSADYHIWVEQDDHEGGRRLEEELRAYCEQYQPQRNAHFVFRWVFDLSDEDDL